MARLLRDALLGFVADLFEARGDALGNDVEGLGVRLGEHQREFARIGKATLEGLLQKLGMLGDALFGSRRLRDVTQDRRSLIDRFADDFGLAPGHGLHALGRELIRLGQRLDVLTLAGEHSLNVEAGQREAGKRLAEIGIQKSLSAIHDPGPWLGAQPYAALHNGKYVPAYRPRQEPERSAVINF